MKITEGMVAFFHYTLTDDAGQEIDSSRDSSPLPYMHGTGQIVPGLETALEGRQVGDTFKVSVQPADGYGDSNPALVQKVPRQAFATDQTLEPGMQFEAQGPQGGLVVVITGVTDEEVTVDANHPLAGKQLNFDVEVMEVREATAEESEHGHVHGPGGHQH